MQKEDLKYEEKVTVAKRLTNTIKRTEAEAEAAKWERAKLLSEMSREHSYGKVGRDVGLAEGTVRTGVRIWAKYGGSDDRPRYAEADYEITGRGAGFQESVDKIAKRIGQDPAYRRKFVDAVQDDPDARRNGVHIYDRSTVPSVRHVIEPDKAQDDPGQRIVRNLRFAYWEARSALLNEANYDALGNDDERRREASGLVDRIEALVAVARVGLAGGPVDEAVAAFPFKDEVRFPSLAGLGEDDDLDDEDDDEVAMVTGEETR